MNNGGIDNNICNHTGKPSPPPQAKTGNTNEYKKNKKFITNLIGSTNTPNKLVPVPAEPVGCSTGIAAVKFEPG